jgi:anti-anti-sigma factor
MNFVSVSQCQNVLVLQIKNFDFERQPAAIVGDELRTIVERSPVPWILLDLVNVGFMTSAFIGQLILLKKRCDNKRLTLKLCGLLPQHRDVLKLVRFDDLVDIHDDKQDAIDSFQREPHDAARRDLIDGSAEDYLNDAKNGQPNAQYMLGLCLEAGQGVEQNIEKATEWIAKAAAGGHAQAQYKLGIAHAFGVGLPQKFEDAIRWFELAAEQGIAEAQYMMGISLQHGIGIDPDEAMALQWYQRAAEQGHPQAKIALQSVALPS